MLDTIAIFLACIIKTGILVDFIYALLYYGMIYILFWFIIFSPGIMNRRCIAFLS